MVLACCSNSDDVAESLPYKVTILCPQSDGRSANYILKKKEPIEAVKERVIQHYKMNTLGVKDLVFYCLNTNQHYYEDCILPPNCQYDKFVAFDMLTAYHDQDGRRVRRPFSSIVPEISSKLSRFILNDTGILCVESAKMPESPIRLVANQRNDTILSISAVAFDHSDNTQQTIKFHVYEKKSADMVRVHVILQDICKVFMLPKETTVLSLIQYLSVHFYGEISAASVLNLLGKGDVILKGGACFSDGQIVSVAHRDK